MSALVLGLGVTSGGAAVATTTFTAAADAHVVQTTINQNNGTATTLKVKPSDYTETAYLKFNVSGLGGAVQSATLRLNAASGLLWGFDAYTTSSTWTETGLTYQNQPTRGTKLGHFPNGNLTGWVSLDVTAAVTGNGTYSFALVGTYWQEISLYARESGANAPQLVITTSGASPPDTQAPSAPTNLSANANANSLALSWTASTDDTAVTGYNLYRDGTKVGTTTSTSYSYPGLTCGTSYTLGVEAYDAAGNTSTRPTLAKQTTACPDTQAPTVPANLAQTSSTTSSVSVNWNAATDNVGVTGYGTYLGASAKGTTTATSATISGLSCGTSYSVGVDAADAAGNRSAQATTTAATAACPVDTQAPSAPTNLSANANANSLALSWTASTDDTAVTGYNLYRDGTKVGTTTSTSYSYPGLTCGTSYTLGVEAYDAAGNTSTRPTLAATTGSCGPTSTTFAATADAHVVQATTNQNNGTATTLKVKPSNYTETAYLKFSVTGLTGSIQSATLRVNAISGLLWGFDAYSAASTWTETGVTYQNQPTRSTKLGSFPSGNLTGWISLDVTPAVTGNGTYSFALVGTYWQEITLSSRESGANAPQLVITSNGTPPPADTQPPTAPTNLTSTGGTTTANLSWTAATDNTAVTGYSLYRSTTVGFTPAPGNRIAQPTSTGYVDTGLAAGTYYYRVTARDAAGNESAPSAEASATVTSGGGGGGTVTPTPVPAANVAGVTVGPGFVEASARQVLRTSSGTVYVITADDNPCQTGGSGVIRAWKGTGAQSANASVPTAFAEQDAGAHPTSAGSGSCVFSSGVTSVLLSPDSRLDASGTIHLAYIDGKNGTVYYQTFFTGTNTWGPRTAIATGALTSSGSGWPRGGQVALTLDASDTPHVLFASSGSIRETTIAGGLWSAPVTVATGTNLMHPSLVTALDGTLHAAWLDNALAAHATIKYAHRVGGSWSAPETVSIGDSLVLNNTDDDQGPSIATDPSNRPHVLYMDGTANGSDDYVRLRYLVNGSWVDNTPPGGAGGPSNPAGTLYAHTPQNYVSATGDDYVFLGHDSVISPGGYQTQPGGPGSNWTAYTRLDPRDQSNTTAGSPGLDGSASIRFDPLRDPSPGIIDLLYYDENDGTAGYDHHSTLYYKAIVIK